jgi:ubiquinone/menaquinone biosynthesis C-methylase UbiE/uncharacterized protein YbaR (Trm112 family)
MRSARRNPKRSIATRQANPPAPGSLRPGIANRLPVSAARQAMTAVTNGTTAPRGRGMNELHTVGDVLEILCCPMTRNSLVLSTAIPADGRAAWDALGERHGLGAVVGVLETSDGQRAYPVWKDVLGLLPGLARNAGAAPAPDVPGTGDVKRDVARFYDEFGWVEGEDGTFNDALAFEDLREVTAFYRERCHRRVNRFLRGGRYLLDVASGPVQIPEYRSFSDPYRYRLCVDLSISGLLKARQRLGEHAICIAGDITALPIREDSVDAFVSMHTIYHVPAQEQGRAVAELYRTLRKGGTGVVVYSWGSEAPLLRLLAKIARFLPVPDRAGAALALPRDVGLYFHAHDFAWYEREVAGKYPTRLRVWRSLARESLQFLVRGRASAGLVLWPLLAFETLFPRWAGRTGVCPMFVITKPAGGDG